MRFLLNRFSLILVCFILCENVSAKEVVDNKRIAKQLSKQFDILIERYIETNDSVIMYQTIAEAIKVGIECDRYDGMPNQNGVVKYQYREKNQILLKTFRKLLVDAGLYMHRHGNDIESLNMFELYINSAENPLFKINENDHYLTDVAYYAANIAYELNNTAKAIHYIDKIINDEEYAQKAAELRLLCLKKELKTPEDSTMYASILLGMHHNQPENKKYLSMLLDYYTSSPQLNSQYFSFLKQELEQYPDKIEGWMLYGDECFKRQLWDDAIESYNQVLSTGPEKLRTALNYNLGICYLAKAGETKKQLADQHGNLSKKNKQKIIPLYDEAKNYLEKVGQSDPNCEVINWSKALYLVYLELSESKKASHLKHLLNK